MVFHSSSNVQKVTKFLKEHYLRVMVQTSTEHTLSLIFGPFYHTCPTITLFKFAKLVSVVILLVSEKYLHSFCVFSHQLRNTFGAKQPCAH